MPASRKSSNMQDSDEAYQVQQILDKKRTSEGTFYLIKWKGYEEEQQRTWQPLQHLHQIQFLVDQFDKEYNQKMLKKRSVKMEPERKIKKEPETRMKKQHQDMMIQEDLEIAQESYNSGKAKKQGKLPQKQPVNQSKQQANMKNQTATKGKVDLKQEKNTKLKPQKILPQQKNQSEDDVSPPKKTNDLKKSQVGKPRGRPKKTNKISQNPSQQSEVQQNLKRARQESSEQQEIGMARRRKAKKEQNEIKKPTKIVSKQISQHQDTLSMPLGCQFSGIVGQTIEKQNEKTILLLKVAFANSETKKMNTIQLVPCDQLVKTHRAQFIKYAEKRLEDHLVETKEQNFL